MGGIRVGTVRASAKGICTSQGSFSSYLCYPFLLCLFFQGMLFALSDCAKLPVELVRLWRHESERVYKDKLIDKSDMELYEKLSRDVIKKSFEVG